MAATTVATGQVVLEVVTPSRTVLRQSVESVLLPALDGYLGIMAGHAPLLAGLSPGVLLYGPRGAEKNRMAVSGGFAEVAGNHVRVLADAAELPEEIDVGRARAALERAEDRLRHADRQVDIARAEMAMRRALARLRTVFGEAEEEEGTFAPGEQHLGAE